MSVGKLFVHANVTICDKRYMWANSLSMYFAVMDMLINGHTVAMDKMSTGHKIGIALSLVQNKHG